MENHQLENIIKYLNVYTSDDVYESIHLFLLNIHDTKVLNDKDKINAKLKQAVKEYDTYKKTEEIQSKDFLIQSLKIIERDLDKLIQQRSKIDYTESYIEELEKKSNVIKTISEIEENINEIEIETSLIKRSIEKLKKEKTTINENQLKKIYNQANSYIPSLNKKFNELIKFHNSMIDNRIKFIQEKLNTKLKMLSELKNLRDENIQLKQRLSFDLLDEGLLKDLYSLNTKIDKLTLEKGGFESIYWTQKS
ncbi:hypothetical protein BHF71_11225 [Vulcanibacillus modesticaldus]|uniref:Uncharacterized protein n=1 Tax=Vulcanibacillus modesticaldus TaxID=337097 RepID=A0A1D2YSE3_9BACI|nr:hypothetical protein [Vulcanibacillus modesticaldus]OEF97203.1 hypothetical protein BHF71_11225 [Vulcanibacillus modesticaldus]